MAAVVSLFVVLTLGLLITRVATVALTMTGMSLEHARFQARSAFTGTGFTTSEAEAIVTHPARRRIVMALMLLSGVGAVSVLGALVLSFTGVDSRAGGVERAAAIVLGLVALLWIARSAVVDRALRRVIEPLLRRFTDLDVRDYASLLHIHGEFAVSELAVEADDWIAGRTLQEVRPADEGLLVLGVQRDATTYLGAPTGATRIRAGDTLIVYGPTHRLSELDNRQGGPGGDVAHVRAMREALAERSRSGREGEADTPTLHGQELDFQHLPEDDYRELLAPTEDLDEAATHPAADATTAGDAGVPERDPPGEAR